MRVCNRTYGERRTERNALQVITYGPLHAGASQSSGKATQHTDLPLPVGRVTKHIYHSRVHAMIREQAWVTQLLADKLKSLALILDPLHCCCREPPNYDVIFYEDVSLATQNPGIGNKQR